MDVPRFSAFGAEDNETVWSITQYGRDKAALLAHMFSHSEARFYAEKRKVATEAERPSSPAARSGRETRGRVDRERGHCCLFSQSLSKLLVSLSISSSFPIDDIHSGQVAVPLAPVALQMSSTCHPSPCNGLSPSPTTMRSPSP